MYDQGFGFGTEETPLYADGFAGNEQQFDDAIAGNDPATYDGLSNFQGWDDILTNNQGYGWDSEHDGGTVWATSDPSTDAANFDPSNFGFGGGNSFDATEQQFDNILNGD